MVVKLIELCRARGPGSRFQIIQGGDIPVPCLRPLCRKYRESASTSLMLQLKQLNIQQPQDFDFMDKCAPDHSQDNI